MGGGRETDWPRVEITARTDVLPCCRHLPFRAGPTRGPSVVAALINRDDLENRYEYKVRYTYIYITLSRPNLGNIIYGR